MLSQARDLPNTCFERFLSSPALGFNRIYWHGFAEKYQVAKSTGLVSARWILIVARTLGIFPQADLTNMQCWREDPDQGCRHKPAPSLSKPGCSHAALRPLPSHRYLCYYLITLVPVNRLLSGEHSSVRTALLACIGVTKTPKSWGSALQKELQLMFPQGFQPLALTAAEGLATQVPSKISYFQELMTSVGFLGTSTTASIEIC